MSRQLIGQLLSRMGKLSLIDIDEILVEQAMSHKRFGEIALSWGLCDPEHVGEAWWKQLCDGDAELDLDRLEIDEQAPGFLSPEVARRLNVVPIRVLGDLALVATPRKLDLSEEAELSIALGKQVRLVTVRPDQIDQAVLHYYPPRAA